MKSIYKRALLKLTGEALGKGGIDFSSLFELSKELKSARETGCQLALVLGGGNLFRGREDTDFPPVNADYLGMTATILNALALKEMLLSRGLPATVMSALAVDKVVEPFNREKGIAALERNEILILAGGLGLPFFTTDTAAAHRALELEAEVVLKATTVEGVFDSNPKSNPQAAFFDEISYSEVLSRQLGVMDLTAIDLCRQKSLPIRVFNFRPENNLLKVLTGKKIGTIIRG